jgi:cytochrome c biogenesis protein CcdA
MPSFLSAFQAGITIIFYLVTAVIAIFSAIAIYLLNKHGENQTVTGIVSIIYGVLFLIVVSNAYLNLSSIN